MRRMIWLSAILGLFVFGISEPVNAENPETGATIFMTGERLTEYCRAFMLTRRQGDKGTPQQVGDAALCLAYVEGIMDAVTSENLHIERSKSNESPIPICLPTQITGNTLTEVVARFLDQNPALRTFGGATLVIRALELSFPCPQQHPRCRARIDCSPMREHWYWGWVSSQQMAASA